MPYPQQFNQLISYILKLKHSLKDVSKLPSIHELSDELQISVSRVREQLEVAKTLGLVEVKPRTGIRLRNYDFGTAAWNSVSFAINLDTKYFEEFSDLRMSVEKSYWLDAVKKLTLNERLELSELMKSAWEKLRSNPIRIPHSEHKQLHMMVYKHLDNTFVLGILETYWHAYEAEGLNIFTDYEYLEKVWNCHQKMVNFIVAEDFEQGYATLIEHFKLLYHRSYPSGGLGRS